MRDPLYSYIAFTVPREPEEATEQQLMDHPWLQRLRRIRENQWAYMVYPGLQHTRFEHALGVMHLAGEFGRTWYGQWRAALGVRRPTKRHPTVFFVEELLRLAGLLHDVGHGPFGHTFEQASQRFLSDNFPTHEQIGVAILRKDLRRFVEGLRRSPSGPFAESEKLKWEQVARLIDKDYQPAELSKDERTLVEQLQPIISGLFDVDRLDYLARDAYHGGTSEYGTMDVDRLRTTIYFVGDGRIAIPSKSMPALRNMLLARLQMYETVYFHPRVRAFEVDAEINTARTLKEVSFPLSLDDDSFLDRYRELDDHWFYGKSVEWAAKPKGWRKELAADWTKLFDRAKRLQCVTHIHQKIDEEYFALVKKDLPAVEEALFKHLADWRTAKKTPSGKRWPGSIGPKADLHAYVCVDTPMYAAGLQDFLEPQSPYVVVEADGTQSKDSTGAALLKQVAGVNFVLLRFLATPELDTIVKEAVSSVTQCQRFSHLRPS